MEENVPTQEVVVLDESFVKVLYDPEKLLGKVIWNGTPKDEQYKLPFEKLLEYGQTHRVKRFLSDTRKQGVVAPDKRKWFEKVMVPAAIEAGMERAAVITDGNAFKRYYLNLILGAVNKFGLPFKILGDEESAVEFLMEA
ncbi:hypothetical protein [Fulvivirga lutea]|uniref:Uncharacterized protein n=1 Tax=Fulvivirga lutea TaxID=2810512 RepID=A0A975A0D2_9BACT|nr:hypothetical protein [Fulvivirga lutea]QSE96686.1 hypothetical protein JR347_13930 [Fulvivirga lutea]